MDSRPYASPDIDVYEIPGTAACAPELFCPGGAFDIIVYMAGHPVLHGQIPGKRNRISTPGINLKPYARSSVHAADQPHSHRSRSSTLKTDFADIVVKSRAYDPCRIPLVTEMRIIFLVPQDIPLTVNLTYEQFRTTEVQSQISLHPATYLT